MNIESFFPGRLRVSSPLFGKPENMDKIQEQVRTMAGVKDVSGNLSTGSLTVVYDPKIITMDMLMQAKGEIEKLELELG